MALFALPEPDRQPLIALHELRDHLRLQGEDGSEDTLLRGLIAAATEFAEKVTARTFVSRNYRLVLPEWRNGPGCGIRNAVRLPKPPAVEVAEVRYLPEGAGPEDAPQLLPPAAWYLMHLEDGPAGLVSRDERGFPDLADEPDAVEIAYRAGYGDDPAATPAPIRHAVLMICGHWYEHTEASSALTLKEVPMAVATLLGLYEVPVV